MEVPYGWYPDYSATGNNSCVDDGNVPEYMLINVKAWMFPNKEGCCKRYFSWDIEGTCMETSSSSAATTAAVDEEHAWYPSWTKLFACSDDPDSEPFYMKEDPTAWMFRTQEDCCKRNFKWTVDACMEVPSTRMSQQQDQGPSQVWPPVQDSKWYVNWNHYKCVQDCEDVGDGDSANCGGMANSWSKRFDTIADCCAKEIFWINADVCAATAIGPTVTAIRSTETKAPTASPSMEPTLSPKWYVDWTTFGCVPDCAVGSSASSPFTSAPVDCGGSGETWNNLHDTMATCCELELYWVENVASNCRNP